jgi:hypothetical protein
MVREAEPLFTLLQTTDDEDDDVEVANDGGPSTRYRDNPSASSSAPPSRSRRKDDDTGPETRYKDDPGASIFNWDDGGGKGDAVDGHAGGDAYHIDDNDFDADDVGFSPVSLHDDDDDEGGGNGRTVGGIRAKANELLKKRVFDNDEDYDEDDDDRIFVGGGWGRHGSQLSWCPRGFCSRPKPPAYSKGPPSTMGSSTIKITFLIMAFLVAVIGCGYLGYEAGLPADDDADDADGNVTTGGILIHSKPHTKGEEWLEASSRWVVNEKEMIRDRRPHWNFPRNEKFNKGTFKPMSQVQLLKLSEDIFQSCSERSLRTTPGRNACLSLCHGHYCCFEKEAKYGGCVAARNSYCFAYAACEIVIGDFEMDNANHVPTNALPGEGGIHPLNGIDEDLLADTCSVDNIVTLDGIRDCNAFCQHHLCCFSNLESENCLREHAGECQSYDACRTLVDGPKDATPEVVGEPGDGLAIVKNDDSDGGGGAQEGQPSAEVKDDNSAIATTVQAVCGLGDKLPKGDDSWVVACHALCANYLCCFSIDGTQSNCRDSYGDLTCDAYRGCAALFAEEEVPHWDTSYSGDEGSMPWEDTEEGRFHEMEEACVPNARVDPVLSDRCRKVCDPRSCCWQDDPGNCASLNESWCGEYQPCSVLYLPY